MSPPDARVAQVVALTRRPTEPHREPRNVGVDPADLPAETCWWNVHGVIGTLGLQANGL
ncbi:hypothetical protein [Aureimonas phyllosphaerae]|uniref:Uncharacterized protein n=1 Tax=Aureimonas phyllosphaerae TaxID=1166078 RepID=A0A7W6BUC4_9HYPH|nr:hypothetical protein [Aureimonas phyllosphaerae]MBB3937072.1 hypothetical protein [Aureimonas phyllosphaerae]MBB3960813.1 hypothetical protein [Aureimonas phyllosphaerae]